MAGVGWFAVNSISGALALSALTGWNGYVCLVITFEVGFVLAVALYAALCPVLRRRAAAAG